MKTWEFEDIESGEQFFVEAEAEEDALATAQRYFEDPYCCGEVDWETADALGYDTY